MPRLKALLAESIQGEAFLRAILAASPDCVKVLSLDGTIEFMNQRGLELNQLSSSEAVLGCSYVDRWPEDERDKIRAAIAAARAGESSRAEGFCPTAQGEARWWEVSFAALQPESGPPKLIAISRDVTKRVRAEQARKAASEALEVLNATLAQQVRDRTAERNMFATIVESTDIMVMACALDYTILAMNKANKEEFERIYGVRPRVGDNMLQLLANQPEHQAQVRAGWGRGLTGRHVTLVEAYGDPARARPSYEVNFRPLYDEQGALIGCYQFVVDVTERLRDQAQLAEAQEALRQSQKLEAIGRLTGGVAHDFNNLLTVIKSSTDLLKRPGLAEERRSRYVAAISETVDRAAKLTGQLLAFARRQALKPEVFDAVASVRGLADMMSTLTGARVRVVTELTDRPCWVNADPSQLDTALINLAVNARDAMDGEGQITIRVAAEETLPSGRHLPAASDAVVAVSVTDTGCGIPEDRREQIFEPFYTTKSVGQGTGLGLSQVFGFAKQSGGGVSVESEVGRGTTFTLYLPRVQGSTAAARPDDDGLPADGHGVRVLVVEDNADVGRSAVQTLTDLGYSTVLAVNAEQALLELDKDAARFDVVFTDVMMPGMNGIDLAREIRRRHGALPVLLTSGYSHLLAEQGSHGFELLQKPYSVDDLARLLSRAMAAQPRGRAAASSDRVRTP